MATIFIGGKLMAVLFACLIIYVKNCFLILTMNLFVVKTVVTLFEKVWLGVKVMYYNLLTLFWF